MWWYWPQSFPSEPVYPIPVVYPTYYCRGGINYPWIC